MIEIDQLSLEQAAARREWDASWRSCCAEFDSATHDSPWSRWTYFPGRASRILQCDGRTLLTTLRSAEGEEQRWDDPLKALGWLGSQCNHPLVAGPPFKGGWTGYLSYDLGRLFEKLPALAADDLCLPLFTFTYHDRVIALDQHDRVGYDCRITPRSGSEASLKFVATYGRASDAPVSPFSRAEYEAAVRRAIDYIAAGDIFQVNLTQRFVAGLPDRPEAIYDTLRRQFPAWFGAYLDYGDHALLCNSPELFLRVTPGSDGRRSALTRPIKGTRAGAAGLDQELRDSLKDQAELNMIVDLERNDLGRVCEIGSVKVTEPRVIEAHPTLFHGAATIEGVLRPGVTLVDLLRATFPGGSVTGAPKIRAMEIIDELEPFRRGLYCGAIGYLSADGHAEFNVAIRTIIARGDRAYISVGGGIVADSVPAEEFDETLIKAQAMFAAIAPRR